MIAMRIPALIVSTLVATAGCSRDPILILVLTGVIIGALLGAAIGLVKYLADPYNQLPAMTFWLLGSLASTTAADLVPLALPIVLGTGLLVALRWRMDAMSLPESFCARSASFVAAASIISPFIRKRLCGAVTVRVRSGQGARPSSTSND